ncbi:MAG: hypothetical protein ACR2HF_10840, partial [Methylococcaceae bacterium]
GWVGTEAAIQGAIVTLRYVWSGLVAVPQPQAQVPDFHLVFHPLMTRMAQRGIRRAFFCCIFRA